MAPRVIDMASPIPPAGASTTGFVTFRWFSEHKQRKDYTLWFEYGWSIPQVPIR